MEMDLRVGTWNVRSLYRSGALKNLIDVFDAYKMDILAIQEIRWLGSGILEKKTCNVYYSCQEKHHTFGTGFIVSKRLRERVIDFKSVNERICKIRLKGKHQNLSIMCVHAPTEDKDDHDKDDFYHLLELTYDECPQSDIKMVIGDFNAKIGKQMTPFVGNQSLHDESNNNGNRLIDFASSSRLGIGSTMFQHKNIHKATWKSPDENTLNQIDHILVDLRHKSSLLDVRSQRGANVDSDHYLVVSKIRFKLKKTFFNKTEPNQKKFDVDELKKSDVRRQYKDNLRSRLQTKAGTWQDVNGWDTLRQVIFDTSEETLPEISSNKQKGWYDEECSKATEKKNKAYKDMLQGPCTRFKENNYKELRRQEKRIHRKKKKNFLEEQFKNIETLKTQKDSRKYFQLINNIRKDFNPRISTCRKKNGELAGGKSEVLERWREHFKDLLDGSDDPTLYRTVADQAEAFDLPSITEIELAIKRLNNNRSAGPDGIKAELLKIEVSEQLKAIHCIICRVWESEQMPIDWDDGSICPIFKKGDKLDCNNYRGITLLNTAFKIFSNVLYKRLLPHVEKVIGSYQCGFQRGKSTIDQIHTLRQIIEKTKEFNIDTYHLFIDYKAAYDSIKRDKLFTAMEELGIPMKLINLTKATLRRVKCKVKLQNKYSEPFFTDRGLRQGDSLACILFNIALEKVIRSSGINTRGTIFQKSTQILAYADDIDIIGRSRQAVIEAFTSLEAASKEMGLNINADKTKYMEINNKCLEASPLKVNGYSFEAVNEFKYLGSTITRNNNISVDINNRLVLANKCYFGLKSQLKSRLIRRSTKINIYKTLLRPVITYGSECWALTKSEENKLMIFERKIMRRIFGAVCENNKWRTLYNYEIYKKYYKQPDIVHVIKANRIRWLGHLFRSADENPTKKVTFSKPGGTRKRGRPPTRWLDSVEKDLKTIGTRNWRTMAFSRARWRKLIETALACPGL